MPWGFDNLKDVLEVLAVPLAGLIAGGVIGLYQTEAQLDATSEKAREDALQAYFDQMSQLIIGAKDGGSTTGGTAGGNGATDLRDTAPDSAERDLARTRTLAVLRRMDHSHADEEKNADRKRYVVRFLSEAGLIDRDPIDDANKERPDDKAAVYLYGAYLDEANLSEVPLQNTNLRGTNLRNAKLTATNLRGADLAQANLTGATLTGATLDDADLTDVTLDGADLSGATGITEERLRQVKSYEGATLPEGAG
jgi:hypothetical protein